jgi:hypothetical protein
MALEARERYSRRALLAGALGVIGSAAAATITGAQRVLAAGSDGETVVIGGDYPDVRSWTRFRSNQPDARPGFEFLDGDPNGTYWATTVAPDRILNSHFSATGGDWRIAVGNGGIKVSGGKFSEGAISAETQHGAAVVGDSTEGIGVLGRSAIGVRGQGVADPTHDVGRGGVFSGGQAQVRLVPSRHGTHPEVGATGDLFVDVQKRLWFCRSGRNWVRLA